MADAGVLGELLTGVHLGSFLPMERSREAAAGWSGDSYALLTDEGGRDLFALVTLWDTAQEADQFLEAYVDLVGAKSLGQ